ncbi:hypothetical protein D3C75_415060 [compost metagenome]
MFGIEQHKAYGYRSKTEYTVLDAYNKRSTTIMREENFKIDTDGELVTFNGIKARFKPWSNHNRGGLLWWEQEGTYLEMDSDQLPKEEMIEVGKVMY